MRYEVRHLSLRSILKFGLLAGALLGALPGLCLGALVMQAIARTQEFLTGIQNVDIDPPDIDAGLITIPLAPFTVNLIDALGLQNIIDTVSNWSAAGPLVFLLVLLSCIVGAGLLLALPMLVFGLFYNMLAPVTGGFRVDLASPPPDDRRS